MARGPTRQAVRNIEHESPDERADARQSVADAAKNLGDSEVGDFDATARVEQQIFGFDVEML